jgi:hypothetical protein
LGSKIIRDDKPEKVNIDVGGLGVGVYDRLREQGVSRSVLNAVNFGGKPNEPPPLDELGNPAGGPANRRAELWQNMKSALEEGRFDCQTPIACKLIQLARPTNTTAPVDC